MVTDNGDGVLGLNDVITYTITVTNTGNVTLDGVGLLDSFTDANGNPLTLSSGPTFVSADQGSLEGDLLVGETATYTATYTIAQSAVDAGGVINTVLADGDSPSGTNVSDDSDDPNDPTDTDPDGDGDPDDPTVTLIPENPILEVTKTATIADDGDGFIGVNDVITYTITVENTGNVTMTGVGIVDTLVDATGNPLTLTTGPTYVSSSLGSAQGTLQVGEVATYTATYIITQSDVDAGGVSNSVVGSGTSPVGTIVNDTSDDGDDTDGNTTDDPTEILIPENPILEVTKTATIADDGDGFTGVNDVITYTITVENTGNVTMTGVGIVDTLVDATGNPLTLTTGPTYVSSSLGSAQGTLQVGEVATYTATYIITQSDVDAGGVSNSVVGSGTSPVGTIVNDTSDDGDDTDGNNTNDPTETITDSIFDLSVIKEVDNTSPIVGENVTFTITLSNEGFVTATNIIVDEVIPSGYTFVSAITTNGVYSDFDGTWTVAQLNPGQVEILQITVQVLGFGDYLNTATIANATGGVDVTPDDNTDTAAVVPICLTIYNEFSPNDDGINDFFNIDCIETYPNNKVEIYNRWGNIVYEKRGYRNDWNGTSNGRAVLNQSDKLPVGTYYYIIDLGDGSKPRVGWLYLNR